MEITVMFKTCTEEKIAFQLCFLEEPEESKTMPLSPLGVSIGSDSFLFNSTMKASSLFVWGGPFLFSESPRYP